MWSNLHGSLVRGYGERVLPARPQRAQQQIVRLAVGHQANVVRLHLLQHLHVTVQQSSGEIHVSPTPSYPHP